MQPSDIESTLRQPAMSLRSSSCFYSKHEAQVHCSIRKSETWGISAWLQLVYSSFANIRSLILTLKEFEDYREEIDCLLSGHSDFSDDSFINFFVNALQAMLLSLQTWQLDRFVLLASDERIGSSWLQKEYEQVFDQRMRIFSHMKPPCRPFSPGRST